MEGSLHGVAENTLLRPQRHQHQEWLPAHGSSGAQLEPHLAVGEDADVVAVDSTLHQVLGVLKHLFLGAGGLKHRVERVLAWLALLLPGVAEGELIVEDERRLLALALLEGQHGPRAAVHPDLALHVLHHVEVLLAHHVLVLVQLLQLVQALGLWGSRRAVR